MEGKASLKALHPVIKVAIIIVALSVLLVGAIGCDKAAKTETAVKEKKVSSVKKTEQTNDTIKEKATTSKEETATTKGKTTAVKGKNTTAKGKVTASKEVTATAKSKK